MTLENRQGFAPKLRPGEVAPRVGLNKDITRVNGKLVVVSARKPDESYVGNSAYTERQLNEVVSIMHKMTERRVRKQQQLIIKSGLYTD